MPLQVALEAYNPFIPLNPDDSGLPIAILNIQLRNPTDEPIEAVCLRASRTSSATPMSAKVSSSISRARDVAV